MFLNDINNIVFLTDTGRWVCYASRHPVTGTWRLWMVFMAPNAHLCVFSTPFSSKLSLDVFVKVVDINVSFHLSLIELHLDIYNSIYDQNTTYESYCAFMKFQNKSFDGSKTSCIHPLWCLLVTSLLTTSSPTWSNILKTSQMFKYHT